MTFTSPEWNLQSIIEEYKAIVGDPSITDQQSADFINYYYQFVMPKELKIFWGYTRYQFYAQPNIDQYIAPTNFQTLNPSVYADGFPIEWYLDPDTFYQDYPQQENKQSVGNGDGATNSFSFVISAFPVLARSVYVTDGTQVAQDDGVGGFTDPNNNNAVLPGAINYLTGSVASLGFANIPAANTTITAASQTYMANRPQGILFFKQAPLVNSTLAVRNAVNMFVLRPVPDQVYLIKMQGIQIPPPLIEYTDVPFRPDLGPLIALGAALQRFKRFNQMDQYDQAMPEFLRYKDVCMQDTYEELLYERSIPKF